MPRLRRKRKTVTPIESLGAQIKRLRMERGLSQPELAALLNVDHATISRWETDRRIPRRRHRAGLTAALGLSWDASRPTVLIPDRRVPALQPLRDAINRVQIIGDEALIDFVADVVALANRWGQRKPR